jgi:hypothetical protein
MNQPSSAADLLNRLDQVASILSEHDPDALTDEDTEAFREAGIRPGQDLRQAIEAAGFDAETLRGPARSQGEGPPPPPPPQGQSLESLVQLKEILAQYDLSNLDAEWQESLIGHLKETGFLQSGLYINISA